MGKFQCYFWSVWRTNDVKRMDRTDVRTYGRTDVRTAASDIVECVITLIKTRQSAPCIAAAFVVIVDAS